MILSGDTKKALQEISNKLGVKYQWLWKLINFESKWNPKVKNPVSSARGLIQFINSTARSLGFKNSLDLVTKYPSITKQLRGPVYSYLKQFKPFPTKQSLYMSVFYPRARKWNPKAIFPFRVMVSNPGIFRVIDYVNYVEGKGKNKLFLPVTAGIVLLLFMQKRK